MSAVDGLPGQSAARKVVFLAALMIAASLTLSGFAALKVFDAAIEPEIEKRANLIGRSVRDEVENALPENGKLILIIDELDHLRVLIEEGWVSYDLLAYLRSLMQHRSRIAFVLGGTNRLADEFWRLLFNAGEVRELGPLTKRQTEQLIREPAQPQIQFEDLVVEQIWRLTGGHPYLTQLVCNRLLTENNSGGGQPKMITLSNLNKIQDLLLSEDDGYLLALWENSTQQEKALLSTAAASVREAGLPVTGSMIARQMRLDPDQSTYMVLKGLADLSRRRLLQHIPEPLDLPEVNNNGGQAQQQQDRDSTYMFAFDLLRLWLIENHPFSATLDSAAQQPALSSPF